jgi:ABC-type uncharacterized transport system fused permease/ATPase subunit
VLDEATSSLDDENELAVLKMLRERLPATGVIAVTHQPTLFGASHQWVLEPHAGAASALHADPVPTNAAR